MAAAVLVGTAMSAGGRKEALRGNRLLQCAVKGCTPASHPGRRGKAATAVVTPGCGSGADSEDMFCILGKAPPGFGSEGYNTPRGARRIPGLIVGCGAL